MYCYALIWCMNLWTIIGSTFMKHGLLLTTYIYDLYCIVSVDLI